MRYADAPPAGWYPDPTGGPRLRWWDGGDWTDHRRVPPPATGGELDRAAEAARDAGRGASSSGGGGPRGGHGVAPRMREAGERAGASAGLSRRDASDLVDEVRRATRSEIERATRDLSGRATDVRDQLGPIVSDYGMRFARWARRAVLVAIVVWLLYTIASAALQTSLIDWLGDRIDNAVNGVVPATSPLTPAP